MNFIIDFIKSLFPKKCEPVDPHHDNAPVSTPVETPVEAPKEEKPKSQKVVGQHKWQVVYNGKYNNYGQTHVITDGFGFGPKGEYSIAYLSAHYEAWRPDAKRFNLRGSKKLGRWKGEKYIDWKHPENKAVMRDRIRMVKEKGYHAIDWDNVDSGIHGYGMKRHNGEAYNLEYYKWLVKETTDAGLQIGLKNAVEFLPYVADDVHFVVSEASSASEQRIYARYGLVGVHMSYGPATQHPLYRVRNGKDGNKY